MHAACSRNSFIRSRIFVQVIDNFNSESSNCGYTQQAHIYIADEEIMILITRVAQKVKIKVTGSIRREFPRVTLVDGRKTVETLY